MQQLSSNYTAWYLLLSAFILSPAYCSIMSCDQFNLTGIIILTVVFYKHDHNDVPFFQYNTGLDSKTINVEVECLHNGYVTISWDYMPNIVESCQIEYLCYSDQIEQVCFYDAFITSHYYTNFVTYI